MDRKSSYIQDIIGSFGSAVALLIAFQTFGLSFLYSFPHLIVWFIWLLNFIGFMFILKTIFPTIRLGSVMNGVWGGIAVYSWSQIFKLSFSVNLSDAISASIVYIIFGIIVIFLGYILRVRDPNL